MTDIDVKNHGSAPPDAKIPGEKLHFYGVHHLALNTDDMKMTVDFYSGVIYYLNGIAPDLFVPIFAVGRVPGWTVQCLEQLQNNILIRPLTLYDGPAARPYVKISERV